MINRILFIFSFFFLNASSAWSLASIKNLDISSIGMPRGIHLEMQLLRPEVDVELETIFNRLFPNEGRFDDLETILNQIECILYAQPLALDDLARRLNLSADELNGLFRFVVTSTHPEQTLQQILSDINARSGSDYSMRSLTNYLASVISTCPYRQPGTGLEYLQMLEQEVLPIMNQLEIAPEFAELVKHQIMLMNALEISISIDEYKNHVPAQNTIEAIDTFLSFLKRRTNSKWCYFHRTRAQFINNAERYGSKDDWVGSAVSYYRLQILINTRSSQLLTHDELDNLFLRMVENRSRYENRSLFVGGATEIITLIERWPLDSLNRFSWFANAVLFISWQPLDRLKLRNLVLGWIKKGPPGVVVKAKNEWSLYRQLDVSYVFPMLNEQLETMFRVNTEVNLDIGPLPYIQVGEELTFAIPLNDNEWQFDVIAPQNQHGFMTWCNHQPRHSFLEIDNNVYECNFDGYHTDDPTVYIFIDGIFKKAKELGLRPHRTIGGGHKHLDLEISFAQNPLLLLRFIIDMQASPFLARILGRTEIDHEHFHYWWFNLPSEKIVFIQERLKYLENWFVRHKRTHVSRSRLVTQMAERIRSLTYAALYNSLSGFKNTSVNLEHIATLGTVELRFPGPARDVQTVELLNKLLLAHINFLKKQIDNDELYVLPNFMDMPTALGALEAIELFRQYLDRLGLDFEVFKYLIHPALLEEAQKELGGN